MKYGIWGLVLLLAILHQDNWLWDNDTLVFGFLPVTLLFHACLSVAAAFTWFLATRFAWPVDADEASGASADGGAKA